MEFPGKKRVKGLSAKKYHSCPAWGSTTLKLASESCVARARGVRIEGKALTVGTLAHTLLLTPELASEEVYVYAGKLPRKGSKARDDLEAKADGRALVTEKMLDDAAQWVNAVDEDRACSEVMASADEFEVSYFWQEEVDVDGHNVMIDCKCRHDLADSTAQLFWDVKTAECAGDGPFAAACARYNYWLQAYHYLRGALIVTGGAWDFGGWLVLEKSSYVARMMTPAPYTMEHAEAAWQKALSTVARAKLLGSDGYELAGVVEQPGWYRRQCDL